MKTNNKLFKMIVLVETKKPLFNQRKLENDFYMDEKGMFQDRGNKEVMEMVYDYDYAFTNDYENLLNMKGLTKIYEKGLKDYIKEIGKNVYDLKSKFEINFSIIGLFNDVDENEILEKIKLYGFNNYDIDNKDYIVIQTHYLNEKFCMGENEEDEEKNHNLTNSSFFYLTNYLHNNKTNNE